MDAAPGRGAQAERGTGGRGFRKDSTIASCPSIAVGVRAQHVRPDSLQHIEALLGPFEGGVGEDGDCCRGLNLVDHGIGPDRPDGDEGKEGEVIVALDNRSEDHVLNFPQL
jgi:hypothetical protein